MIVDGHNKGGVVLIRMGRSNIIYSGSVTWSSGLTYTAAQTLTFSCPASAGLTTLLHEVVFTTNHTGNITADIRPVMSIGGATVYGDLGISITIPGVALSKSISVDAINTQTRGLFNNATGIVGLLFTTTSTAALTASISVNCVIQELEGT